MRHPWISPIAISPIELFGQEVAKIVDEVTDVSRPSDGNRRTRKTLDLEHLALASPKAQTLKVADVLDNAVSINYFDDRFSKVFDEEARAIINRLRAADKELRFLATSYFRSRLKDRRRIIELSGCGRQIDWMKFRDEVLLG